MKVRLIENRVNNHVGTVIVAKVMTRYKTLGTTWKKKRKRRPINVAIVTRQVGYDKADEKAGGAEDNSVQAGPDGELHARP